MPSISAVLPSRYKSLRPFKSDNKSLGSCGSERSTSACYSTAEHSTQALFHSVLQNQTAYAQYMKLLALFLFAVVHAMYMLPFLNIFTAFNIDMTDVTPGTGLVHFRHFVDTLVDYEKNMWMIVGTMCVALSTSCFILMPNASSRKTIYDIVVRGIDLLTLVALPSFLIARLILLNSISEQLPVVLNEVQFTHFSKQFSAALRCSFIPVTEVPLCDHVIRSAFFPAYMIKFLIILAILTVAYMLLAYLIEWCLRHWFPPQCNLPKHASVYAPIAMAI